MLSSEDYIVRIIRQASAVLAAVIGLKRAGQVQPALQHIDQALQLLFGLEARIVRAVDDDSLYRLLEVDGQLDLDRLALVADLFNEEGELHKLQGHTAESVAAFTRALNQYLMLSLNSETACPEEVTQKIEGCLRELDPDRFEEKTLWNLFCHHENAAQFSRADGILAVLASRPQSRAVALAQMRAYYQRLLERSPQQLSANGLTLAHIRAKLKELG